MEARECERVSARPHARSNNGGWQAGRLGSVERQCDIGLPGYTHCPKVGPETLGKLAEATARLGDAAMRVKVLFISVDPKRDMPASPGRYVNAFDAHHDVCATGRRVRSDPQLGRYIFDTKGPARLIGG